ncbi:unnamed protein product [Ostreobium quekettii]|uniref:Uncharacterized protein n=1 Tax=Ostreobium quekettii TaxID=121088 RepID=A0A8S1IU60_9CHLO|nr:unnamed protein product [Ostreobium quekettii]
MASHHLSSSALGGCPGLYVRRAVAGAPVLGVRASRRKSCARRAGVTCAQRAAKSGPKAEDRRWGLNLWGTTKKAAVANGKSPAVRGTQQIRRRQPGTAKVQKPAKAPAKARRTGAGDKLTAEMVKAKQNAAKCLKDIAAAEKRLEQLKKSSANLGERATVLQTRARECQSAERSVAAGAVAAQKAAEKAQKDLDMLRSKTDGLAKKEAAARAVLSAIQNAARAGMLLSKQEQDAIARPILQPEVAQRKAELAEKKAALAVAKAAPKAVTVAPKAAPVNVQMTEPVAPKMYAPPPVSVEDLEAKAGEAKAKGDINEEARLRAQAASEARRQGTEKAIAERAAKLEADQRAREAAAEEARKAILAEAKAKAIAATKAKREAAAKKKIADAAKQKAKAEAQREAQRAAQEKEKREAQAKAEEAARKQAEAKAKEEAEKKAVEEKAKAEEEAKKIAAAKAEAAAQKKKAAEDKAAALKTALEAKKKVAAAAKASRPPAAGFKWPWDAAAKPAPEPTELVERREDAQQWIDNWKNGAPAGSKQEAEKRAVASAKPKVAEAESAAAEKKTAAAAKAKRPAAAAFRWPWEGPPDPEELVQRRQEAQEWIDNWKARCAEDGKK